VKKFAGNRYAPESQRVQNRTVNLVLSISSHARSRAVMRSQEGRSGYCDGKPKRQRGALARSVDAVSTREKGRRFPRLSHAARRDGLVG